MFRWKFLGTLQQLQLSGELTVRTHMKLIRLFGFPSTIEIINCYATLF
jgi:hypothetical protein